MILQEIRDAITASPELTAMKDAGTYTLLAASTNITVAAGA